MSCSFCSAIFSCSFCAHSFHCTHSKPVVTFSELNFEKFIDTDAVSISIAAICPTLSPAFLHRIRRLQPPELWETLQNEPHFPHYQHYFLEAHLGQQPLSLRARREDQTYSWALPPIRPCRTTARNADGDSNANGDCAPTNSDFGSTNSDFLDHTEIRRGPQQLPAQSREVISSSGAFVYTENVDIPVL